MFILSTFNEILETLHAKMHVFENATWKLRQNVAIFVNGLKFGEYVSMLNSRLLVIKMLKNKGQCYQ